MRYMLDTCAVIHLMTDYQSLSKNIHHIFESYDTQLHISSESIKELIIAYRSKGLWHKKWKKELDIIHSVANDFQIEILPVGKHEMQTYANLHINLAEDHRDPSDHIIIAHAITNRMPLISCDRKFHFYTQQGLDLITY